MENAQYLELAPILTQHRTFAIRAGTGTETLAVPYAFRLVGDALTMAYAVRDGSDALAALRRRTGITFTVGTHAHGTWLEGEGRAVIVHDATVAAEWLARIDAQAADGIARDPATYRAVRIVPEQITRRSADANGAGQSLTYTFASATQRWGYANSSLNERFNRFFELTRANVAPVMAMPVSIGAALAWQREGVFRPVPYALTLVGAVAAHLASNVTNDIFDFRSGADERAHAMAETGDALDTSSGALTGGALSERQANLLAAGLWGTALACGIGIAKTSGPGVLAMAGGGFALGTLYVAPPFAYGYIGRGLGEVGILASFGLLPTLGSYYAQTGKIGWAPVIAALPPGLFTTDVLLNHHFFHWRADKAVGKNTPVAILGEQRAATASRAVLAAACASVVAGIAAKVYPITALAGIATAGAVWKKLGELGDGNRTPAFYGDLMDRTVKGSSRMGLALLGSVVLSGLAKAQRNRLRGRTILADLPD